MRCVRRKTETGPDERLFRPEEVAANFGVCVTTVRRWCAAGLLDGVTLPRGGLRIRASSLSEILRASPRAERRDREVPR